MSKRDDKIWEITELGGLTFKEALTSSLGGFGFSDYATCYESVCHVDHSLSMCSILDAKNFSGGSIVELEDDLVGVGLGNSLGDGPAHGHVLVNDGLSEIFVLW